MLLTLLLTARRLGLVVLRSRATGIPLGIYQRSSLLLLLVLAVLLLLLCCACVVEGLEGVAEEVCIRCVRFVGGARGVDERRG